MNVTRNQLIGFGATKYLAIVLTKPLALQGKDSASNLYSIKEVIDSAQNHLVKPRVRDTTKATLRQLIQELSSLMEKIVELPFGAPETETALMVKQLLKPSKTRKHRLRAAAIKGKRTTHAQ